MYCSNAVERKDIYTYIIFGYNINILLRRFDICCSRDSAHEVGMSIV